MNRCQELEEQISLYIDDLLDDAAAAEVREHLDGCPACAGLTSDLARIARSARLLGPIVPPAHVYASIAEQLPAITQSVGQARQGRQGRPIWRWAAVAATLVAAVGAAYLGGGVSWFASPSETDQARTTHTLEAVASELDLAVQHYERAISQLEAVAATDDNALDPEVAQVVDASLRAIDRAITESRQALTVDPANEPARVSLFEALHRKIDLLQATALIRDESPRTVPAGVSRLVQATGREI